MDLAEAILVRRDVEPGWALVGDDVPLGKKYLVDLDSIQMAEMTNTDDGRTIRVACILVLSPGPPGMLPIMAFVMRAWPHVDDT
jgi:hypothetical protein